MNYPPERHVDHDIDNIHAVMERFPFATLISVHDGRAVVTQVPLILDRSRAPYGVLFGHMDRSNPHVQLLDDRDVTAVFNGPNGYITPHTYATSQLPTWNSISVHLTGRTTILYDKARLVSGLQRICEAADPSEGAYRMPADEPRIATLIDYIVGFEIAVTGMIGRFKLSQDRDVSDRAAAAEALIRRTKAGEREIVLRLSGRRPSCLSC